MNIKLLEGVHIYVEPRFDNGNRVIVATVTPDGQESFELKYPVGVATAAMLKRDVKAKLGIE